MHVRKYAQVSRLKFLKRKTEIRDLFINATSNSKNKIRATRVQSYAPVRTADYRSQQVRLSSSTRRACGSNTVEQETEERTAKVATSLFARANSLAIRTELNNFALTRCRLPRTECIIPLLFSISDSLWLIN